MKKLVHYKAKAVALRKKGMSYNEILKQVPVAKSSLSLWLKDLPLTKSEKKSLRTRLDSNISHGRIKAAGELRKRRLDRESVWFGEAEKQFKSVHHEPLFHAGVSLYWAEGAKRSNQWQFTNSDVEMVEIMLFWVEKYFGITKEKLRYRLYIHKPYAQEHYERWWEEQLVLPYHKIEKITFKPTQLGIKKRPNYRGCIRCELPRSKGMLCKMKFWTNMLVEYHRKQ